MGELNKLMLWLLEHRLFVGSIEDQKRNLGMLSTYEALTQRGQTYQRIALKDSEMSPDEKEWLAKYNQYENETS